MITKPFYTRKEVCQVLDVSKSTYGRLVKAKAIRTFRLPGWTRKQCVARNELQKLVQQLSEGGTVT